MDKLKLLLGLGVLLILAGGLLAAFTPGGFLNRADATIVTPIGTLSVRDERRIPLGPVIGYVTLGLGGAALVIAFAMRKTPGS